MEKKTAEQVAAQLTVAATQNAVPDPVIVGDPIIVAESIVKLYENIYKRLVDSKVVH